MTGNLQVRFLEGWAPAMASGRPAIIPAPCHSDRDLGAHSISSHTAYAHPAAFLFLISEISESPPPLLHRRIFRFSLTRAFLGNRLVPWFRRLRRDSRFVIRAKFLYEPSCASSPKRGVPARLLFSTRAE